MGIMQGSPSNWATFPISDKREEFPTKETLLKFICQYCTRPFPSNWKLQQHIRTHTGETPFKCKICGRAFKQKGCARRHMMVHLSDEKN